MFPRVAVFIACLLVAAVTTFVGVAFVREQRAVESAKPRRVAADIQAFETQLKVYRMTNGSLPTTKQGLHALIQEPTSSPRPTHWYKLFGKIPADPWNTAYIYRSPGVKHPDGYDLFSAGPDRKPDTADDVWGK